jgi:hypothetical protein
VALSPTLPGCQLQKALQQVVVFQRLSSSPLNERHSNVAKDLIARTDIARLPSSKSTLPIYESGQLGNVDACPEEVREIQ